MDSSPPQSRESSPSKRTDTPSSIDLSSLPPLILPSPPSNTLLITNLMDPAIFRPEHLRTIRDLINQSAPVHSWAPLKSFRRIVVSFFDVESAIRIRQILDGEPIMDERVRIFFGEPTPTEPVDQHLHAPQSQKMFFISPPPSPPHGWEMKLEDPPNKAVHADDLAAALARLHAKPAAAVSPVSSIGGEEAGAGPSTQRHRSGSSTMIYHPKDHGDSLHLPIIEVEDTTGVPDEPDPFDETDKPTEGGPQTSDAATGEKTSKEVDPAKEELESKNREIVSLKVGRTSTGLDVDGGCLRCAVQDKYLRSVADFRNLQDRTQRDVHAARDFAIQRFAKDLIDSVDNLDRALSTVPETSLKPSEKEANTDLVNLYDGLRMTETILMQTLEKHGLKRFDPSVESEPFNPNLHEATFQTPVDGKEDGTVMLTQQKGFTLNGRVLRVTDIRPTMALLVDKHRPKSLHALTYHKDLSQRLQSLAQSGDFPHLLVYGPSGAGKKTRIVATLKELYGPGVEKIKIDARVFQTSSNRKLEFNIVASVYHLEITPSDVGNWDRVVVQELLKEVAQTQQVDQTARQRFKVVVINEADQLTRDAQAALRRTMEKYSPNLRLILLANSTANIIAPIRSRTLLVRVAAPQEEEICAVLRHVGHKEGWSEVADLNQRIARDSGRNLRKALLMFEAVHAQNEKVTEQTAIPPPDWEALIAQVAEEIMSEHTPERILQVRAKLYDLLSHCIPATTILKATAAEEATNLLRFHQTLTFKLVPKIDEALKAEVIKWSAFYEHRIRMGSKVIFHLEAFVAKFMRLLETYLMGMDFADI
ncbi:MAG: Replication factor C (RF-C) subunit [Thelocarpon superellum]|nr:MAG: Replication factor C (RF-C) subunit [Thelocarpon superellum]